MSRTLQAMTGSKFYSEWIARALEIGIPETDIYGYVEKCVGEARALLAGKCPLCGAPSARYVDYERQSGPSEIPGIWVMYRCSTQPPPGQERGKGACDYMLDLREGEAAN